MNFLLDAGGDLIALIDIAQIYDFEHEDKSRRCVAALRAGDEPLELSRDYTMESLRRALDPLRNGSGR